MTRRSSRHPLRQGFTTGSAAAAAAKAALSFLLTGASPAVVDIPLPPGGRLAVPVDSSCAVEGGGFRGGIRELGSPDAEGGESGCPEPGGDGGPEQSGCGQESPGWDIFAGGRSARATVVKDAGDDPDATHGARISCLATLGPPGLAGLGEGRSSQPCQPCQSGRTGASGIDAGTGSTPEGLSLARDGRGRVDIVGGRGVGRVTLPGLPVQVGRAAINPVPLAQIELSAREAMEESGYTGRVRLVIEVEGGEDMARRTLNPRLGVLGGISILGTQGIVKPFSLEAWKATIDSGLEVARAAGCRAAAFSTGRRGERLLMARRPDLPELAFVQAADFFAYATQRAVRMGFPEIVWGCFFGKLAKMAQGLASTHAHAAPTDFSALAELAGLAGAGVGIRLEVSRANTARHALEIVPKGLLRQRFAAVTAAKALEAARAFASAAQGACPRIGICCFGFEGGVLAEAYTS